MEQKLFAMLGKLYAQLTLVEEENARLRLEIQSKEEELGLLKAEHNGHCQTGISNK